MVPRWFLKGDNPTEEFLLQDLQDILQAPQPAVNATGSSSSLTSLQGGHRSQGSIVYNPLASARYSVTDDEQDAYNELPSRDGVPVHRSMPFTSSSFVLGIGTAVGLTGAAIAVAVGSLAAGPVGLVVGSKVGTAFAAGCVGASGIACHFLKSQPPQQQQQQPQLSTPGGAAGRACLSQDAAEGVELHDAVKRTAPGTCASAAAQMIRLLESELQSGR